MAMTTWKGPVNTINGFYFHPSAYTDARGMTITCTSLIRAAASSPGQSATITAAMAGGLTGIVGAWANVRQRTAATLVFPSCTVQDSGNSVVLNLIRNVGTGDVFEGRNATIDVFILGYVE